MTTWTAGMRITADRLNNDTPTTTTAGLVAAAGWAVNAFTGYRAGNVIALDMYLNRTGAVITATTGDIPDTLICTVPAGWRPTTGTISGAWDSGVEFGGFMLLTDGTCTLRTASDNINTGANPRLHITFIVD